MFIAGGKNGSNGKDIKTKNSEGWSGVQRGKWQEREGVCRVAVLCGGCVLGKGVRGKRSARCIQQQEKDAYQC